jgi:hypothetical protein
MPDEELERDIEIVRSAYAERVSDAFRIFAENLGMGQGEKSCTERFVRALSLTRKARDLALAAVQPAAVAGEPAMAEAASATAPSDPSEGLSAEDKALIEHALAGTTGIAAPRRR